MYQTKEWKNLGFSEHESRKGYETFIELKNFEEEVARWQVFHKTHIDVLNNKYSYPTGAIIEKFKETAALKKEYEAVSILEQGFLKPELRVYKHCQNYQSINTADTYWYPYETYDREPLFSLNHGPDKKQYANTFNGSRPLTVETIKEARSIVHQQKCPAGCLIKNDLEHLIIHPSREQEVFKLFVENMELFKEEMDLGYHVSHYLRDPDLAVFVTTINNEARGLLYFNRQPLEIISGPTCFTASERYSFCCTDPRAVFGFKISDN